MPAKKDDDQNGKSVNEKKPDIKNGTGKPNYAKVVSCDQKGQIGPETVITN